ncbi:MULTISPECIES: CopG family transcriptional regulator [Rhizobium]|uniref:CopG family transcriptional regulator n=1 Tax=Rhizobium TaxID=379 RepID=UPI001FF53A3C|nr:MULTISPECIES: CopG family transcriptional regulator [Rhizobium]
MPDFAALLEDAANRIVEISARDLLIILRRAALQLRNSGLIVLDDDTEEALRNVSSELVLTREDAIRYIVREWMEKNTYLPVHELDERATLMESSPSSG